MRLRRSSSGKRCSFSGRVRCMRSWALFWEGVARGRGWLVIWGGRYRIASSRRRRCVVKASALRHQRINIASSRDQHCAIKGSSLRQGIDVAPSRGVIKEGNETLSPDTVAEAAMIVGALGRDNEGLKLMIRHRRWRHRHWYRHRHRHRHLHNAWGSAEAPPHDFWLAGGGLAGWQQG